ncbi:MAG: hypothetical protein FWC00_04975 [Firmicutes bacterium]|nr:hypothetical protein [Bacillota bacterium]
MYKKVDRDLFGISERLKRINPKYTVFRNQLQERFEVHTDGLDFVVPNNVLDSRVIDYALKTRKENEHDIEQEVEQHNKQVFEETKKQNKVREKRLADMLTFASRAGRTVGFSKQIKEEF